MQQQSLLSNVCTLMPNGSVSHTAMRSFVAHCPELLTEDVIRRLMTPIECAMTMMSQWVWCFYTFLFIPYLSLSNTHWPSGCSHFSTSNNHILAEFHRLWYCLLLLLTNNPIFSVSLPSLRSMVLTWKQVQRWWDSGCMIFLLCCLPRPMKVMQTLLHLFPVRWRKLWTEV